MIVVHIKPTGVDRVFFSADSDPAEDSCLAAWPVIRKELRRLDKKLQETGRQDQNLKSAGKR
jgi:hypothetical protein